jgi:hypothetical protein
LDEFVKRPLLEYVAGWGMREEFPTERTRRSLLRAGAGVLGLGAVGSASAHPGTGKGHSSAPSDGEDLFALDNGQAFRNARTVGYHSMAGVGPARTDGRAAQRHDGDTNAEIRTHGDIAVTCYRASGGEDEGRRLGVLDISEFNDASTRQELEEAEFTVLSILRNIGAESNLATDLKLSDDGDYAFIGTQALVPVDGGSNGKMNISDARSRPETSGGVVAVDISDPGRPRTVDVLDSPFSTGVHNLFHHRIDGTDYVFACKDLGFLSVDSGLYIARFDRDPGKLTLVNRWTADGNTVRGGIGAQHGLSYVHDVEVQDDPRNGRPTAYVADWDRGLRVLDVSDPTNVKHIGQFDMFQSHFATPFPDVVEMPNGETKRVAIASHEEPDEKFDQQSSVIYNTPHEDKTNPNSTGTVFMVDCDGIYPDDPGYTDPRSAGDGPKQLGELDNWTWKNVDTDPNVSFADIDQPSFSFMLSPHNSQVARHEVGNEERFYVHQSHYHGGTRYLEVKPGNDDGLTGDARRDYRPDPNPSDQVPREEPIGWINNGTDWSMVDRGHARPRNAETGDLSPDFWSSVEHNGVTYSGDRGAGVYASHHNPIPLTAPRPPLEVTRQDDGTVFTAGGTNQIDITVETFERGTGEAASVTVRDRIPSGYEVVGVAGDIEFETYPQGVRTAVEFSPAVEPGETRTFTYFIETDAGSGGRTLGPVEVSSDGAEWAAVAGTTDTNENVGLDGL